MALLPLFALLLASRGLSTTLPLDHDPLKFEDANGRITVSDPAGNHVFPAWASSYYAWEDYNGWCIQIRFGIAGHLQQVVLRTPLTKATEGDVLLGGTSGSKGKDGKALGEGVYNDGRGTTGTSFNTWDSPTDESIYTDGVPGTGKLHWNLVNGHGIAQFSADFHKKGVGFFHIFGTVDNLWVQGQQGKDPVVPDASKDADEAAKKAEAEKKAAADKLAADKVAADKAASDKAASDSAAADKATANKAAADKALEARRQAQEIAKQAASDRQAKIQAVIAKANDVITNIFAHERDQASIFADGDAEKSDIKQRYSDLREKVSDAWHDITKEEVDNDLASLMGDVADAQGFVLDAEEAWKVSLVEIRTYQKQIDNASNEVEKAALTLGLQHFKDKADEAKQEYDSKEGEYRKALRALAKYKPQPDKEADDDSAATKRLSTHPETATAASVGDVKTPGAGGVSTIPSAEVIASAAERLEHPIFNPNGDLLAVSDDYEAIAVFDSVLKTKLFSLDAHKFDPIAWSPDGRFIAAGTWHDGVELWDVVRRQKSAHLKGDDDEIQTLCFSRDGRHLAGSYSKGSILIWNIQSGELEGSVHPTSGYAGQGIAFSADGSFLYVGFSGFSSGSGSSDYVVAKYSIPSGELREKLTIADLKLANPPFSHKVAGPDLELSPDGTKLLIGLRDPIVFNLTNKEVLTIPINAVSPQNVSSWEYHFSPDGKGIAILAQQNLPPLPGSNIYIAKYTVWFWSPEENKANRLFDFPDDEMVSNMCFSPDGNRLVFTTQNLRQEGSGTFKVITVPVHASN